MVKPSVLQEFVYISQLFFLVTCITASEAKDFTVSKAIMQIEKIHENLVDFVETGNPAAKVALDKLSDVTSTNIGLREIGQKAKGIGVTDPQEMALCAFVPATSMNVERLFSVLQSFSQDRPRILEETINKLMFVRYNKRL